MFSKLNFNLLTSHQDRNFSIDVLRGLAVILILIEHSPDQSIKGSAIVDFLIECKFWIGVDLFFVLSGFLISSLFYRQIKRKKAIQYKRFYIRRFLRILPVLYLTLIFIFAFSHFFVVFNPPNSNQILSEFLFLQNYVEPYLGVTWSLAIEEHFYILLPFAIRFLAFKGGEFKAERFRNILIALILFITLYRSLYVLSGGNLYFSYVMSHFRFDSLLAGVLTAHLWFFHREELKPYITKTALLFLLIISLFITQLNQRESVWNCSIGFSILYLTFSVFLLYVLYHPLKKNAFFFFVAETGKASYIIYLWHLPFWYFLRNYLCLHYKFDGLFLWSVYFFANIIFGKLLTLFLEEPILKLRDKLYP